MSGKIFDFWVVGSANCVLAMLIGFGSPSEAAAANPIVTGISGESNWDAGITNGVVDMSIGKAYNGLRVINDEPGKYSWTIYGTNFGTKQGQVTIAGRTVAVTKWSNTQIIIAPTGAAINPRQPWSWGPMCTTTAIYTSNGTAFYGVNIAPAIRTRIYGQCTWWVAYRRLIFGKLPSPSAYNVGLSLTPAWEPEVGDQLQFPLNGFNHTAIIEDVIRNTSPTFIRYSIRISQYNATGRNEYGQFNTTFTVTRTSTGARGSIIEWPKFSTNGAAASRYYR
jgi:hypothetical protein